MEGRPARDVSPLPCMLSHRRVGKARQAIRNCSQAYCSPGQGILRAAALLAAVEDAFVYAQVGCDRHNIYFILATLLLHDV